MQESMFACDIAGRYILHHWQHRWRRGVRSVRRQRKTEETKIEQETWQALLLESAVYLTLKSWVKRIQSSSLANRDEVEERASLQALLHVLQTRRVRGTSPQKAGRSVRFHPIRFRDHDHPVNWTYLAGCLAQHDVERLTALSTIKFYVKPTRVETDLRPTLHSISKSDSTAISRVTNIRQGFTSSFSRCIATYCPHAAAIRACILAGVIMV